MEIQFIYTFHGMPQIITEYEDIFRPLVINKIVLMSYALSKILPHERSALVKISMCLSNCTEKEVPKWYNSCNGKIWLDDLEDFRRMHDIKSDIPKDIITQFG